MLLRLSGERACRILAADLLDSGSGNSIVPVIFISIPQMFANFFVFSILFTFFFTLLYSALFFLLPFILLFFSLCFQSPSFFLCCFSGADLLLFGLQYSGIPLHSQGELKRQMPHYVRLRSLRLHLRLP